MRDLKEEYLFLNHLKQEIARKEAEIALCERLIREHKAKIRNQNSPKAYRTPKWKSRGDAYDRRYCKEVFDGVWTQEECEEYRETEWEEWYNPYEDGRDCTGVWFTTWIGIFPIPCCNKTIVYHFQNCDV